MSIRIPGVYVEISGNITKLEKSLDDAKAIVRADSIAISNYLNNAIKPESVERGVMGLIRNLQRVSSASKLTGEQFRGLSSDIGELRSMTGLAEKDLALLQGRMLQQRVTDSAERSFLAVAKAAKLTATEQVMLRYRLGDTDGAARMLANTLRSQVSGGFTAARNAVFSFQTAMAGLALAGMVKAIFDAGVKVQKLQIAFDAITGSSAGTAQEFAFLRGLADQLGANFYVLAEEYKGIAAASQGTNIEGEATRDIFTAVTEATTALGMSGESTRRTLKAIGQVMSKGKLQAEELRQQLGDHLYGAFNKAAEAMGITTEALDKMLQDGAVPAAEFLPKFAAILHRDFGDAARKAADTAQAAVNKFDEGWTDLKANMANKGFLESATAALRDLTATFKDPDTQRSMADFATNLGAVLKNLAELARYAGLRSVGETFSQGVDLAGQGLLDLQEFTAASFVERQRMVDDALAKQRELNNYMSGFRKADEQETAAYVARQMAELRKMTDGWLLYAKGRDAATTRANKYEESRLEEQYKAELQAQEKATREAEKLAERQATAREKLIADLAKMNDTGTDGEGRIAALTKDYNEFVKTLGAADAQVRQYADALAYAREHNGYTAQQVAGFTRDADKQAQELKDRADNLRKATRDDGTVDSQRFSYLEKISEAQRLYTEDVLKVGEAKARELQSLRVDEAKTSRAQEDLATRESFFQSLAGLYANDEALQREILDKQVRNYRDAGVAQIDLARWKARKELEMATDAASGMRRALTNYYEDAQNAATNWANVTGNAVNSLKDAMVDMCTTGKMEFGSMIDSMIADVMRLIVRTSITGPLAQALGGMIGGLFTGSGGTGGDASGAWGSYSDRVVGVSGTRAGGGPVLAGNTYLVGENGPELFTPDTSGAVWPNRYLAGGMGTNVEIHVHESANAKAEVTQTPTANGVRLDVVIKDVVAQDIAKGGKIDQAIAGRGFSRTSRMAGRG